MAAPEEERENHPLGKQGSERRAEHVAQRETGSGKQKRRENP